MVFPWRTPSFPGLIARSRKEAGPERHPSPFLTFRVTNPGPNLNPCRDRFRGKP